MKTGKKIIIKVCMGSSCFVRGNSENLAYIEEFIKNNKLDAEIELFGQRCENKCDLGPNIIINDKLYEKVDLRTIKNLLGEMIVTK